MNDPYKIKRTPLRYPGGKSRAVEFLFSDENMPTDSIKEYREPFLGGGSPAIAFTKKHPNTPVWVNDKYYNLYVFWKVLQSDGDDLSDFIMAKRLDYDTPEKAKELQLEILADINDQRDEFEIAWRFYIINRCSFSGLTESSTFSELSSIGNWNESLITGLKFYSRLISNWKITNVDYKELFTDDPDTFIFLDPPYDLKNDYGLNGGDGESLYGKKGEMHRGFNHVEFAETCKAHKCMQMVTYNSNENIRALFEGWNQKEWDLTYSMNNGHKRYEEAQKDRKELLCTNYDTTPITLEAFL